MVSEQLKEDSELRNKWMNQLLTHEEKYQEGRVQMREMLLQAAEYEKRADEFLLNLRLDIDLGEQIEEDANANNYAMPFSFGATQQQKTVYSPSIRIVSIIITVYSSSTNKN
jgi:hypothetical protein